MTIPTIPQINVPVTWRDDILAIIAKMQALVHIFLLSEEHWEDVPNQIVNDYFWILEEYIATIEKQIQAL